MDYKKLIKALKCDGYGVGQDGDGCTNKRCKYRDSDGACNIVSMCEDAATAITDLLDRADEAEYELEQRKGYYDQMVDALAAVDSKELEEAKKKLKAAEARAKKAEKEKNRYKACVYHSRPCELCKKYSADWTPKCCKCANSLKKYHPLFELKEE